MLVKMGIFSKVRGENKKYLSCHHLDKDRSYELEFAVGFWLKMRMEKMTQIF